MSATVTTPRIHASSTLLKEAWYYDDTYIRDDDTGEVLIFVRHFVEYRTKGGNVHRRRANDVVKLADDDEIATWISEHKAKPSGDPEGKNRAWTPKQWAGATR